MAGRLAAMAAADEVAGRDPGKKGVYLKVIDGGKGFGPNSGWNHEIVPLPNNLTEPLRWKKPRRVFVNSMSDLFHEGVPFDFVDRVFAVMALCPQHTFQILTKRPERMAMYLSEDHNRRVDAITHEIHGLRHAPERKRDYERNLDSTNAWLSRNHPRGSPLPLPNVWLGTSCEDQPRADERITHLRRCPAAVHFLSAEPLIGPIQFDERPGRKRGKELDNIEWVIVGGESGHGARPCNVAWVRSIVEQCAAAAVPVFVKQLGKLPHDAKSNLRTWPVGPIGRGFGTVNLGGEDRLAPAMQDGKGGEPSEWPADLAVRQFPAAVTPAPATA